jgi:cobalt/nickel transport system permease protein
VLLEEALRMVRARQARSFGQRGKDIKTFVRLISVLLVRTVERAERIYQAMLSRGFRGEIRLVKRYSLRVPDVLFASSAILLFFIFRKYTIVTMLGGILEKVLG